MNLNKCILFCLLALFSACQSASDKQENKKPSFAELLERWDIEPDIELLFILDKSTCISCSRALLDILEALAPEKHRICSSLLPNTIDLSRYYKEPYQAVYRKDYTNSFRKAGYTRGSGLFLLKRGEIEKHIELDAKNINEQIAQIRALLIERKLLDSHLDTRKPVQWLNK